MTRPPTEPTDGRPESSPTTDRGRRRFLALFGGVGTALLAGCTGNADLGVPPAATGEFRLLISDAPADIGDFDTLVVEFDRGRIYHAEEEPTDTPADSGNETTTEAPPDGGNDTTTESPATGGNDTATASPTGNETDSTTDTAAPANETDGNATATGTESLGDDEADSDQRDWEVIDLSGESADLTGLVGEKAQPIFEGELPAGRYTKLELFVADVEGVVDDEDVDVKVPSGKLQLTKPFEVDEGEEVSFVFDVNVVRKGSGGYNLRPVVAESGVAGEEVPVEEVETTDEDGTTADGTTDNETAGNETGTDAGSPVVTEPEATATNTTG